MTGTTNQVQTPISSGARTILANAANTVGGLALIPANPSASVTGVFPGCLFTVWEAASLAANVYTPVLLARYNSSAANGVGTAMPYATAINFGSITQLNNAFTGTIPTLTSITASSLIQFSSTFNPVCAALTTLSLSSLKYVGGDFSPTLNNASFTTLSLPALVAVNGAFQPAATSLTTMTLTNLQFVGSGFNPNMALLTTLDISSMIYASSFGPTFAALTSLSAPALTTIGASGGLGIVATLLTTLSLPVLATIGNLGIGSNFPALVTMSLPAIVSIGNNVSIAGANIANFSMNTGLLAVLGNWTMTGCALTQASVDGILVRLAALDGTGGTTAYSGFTVNLSGGTSSAPSATGLTAKATLQGRGCTVTTN